MKSLGNYVRLGEIDDAPTSMRFGYSDEDVAELAASIRAVGVLQPILVRKVGERYELIAGHRRVHAARLVGMVNIAAIVVDADAERSVVMALSENLNRADMNVIEEGVAFGRWLETTGGSAKELGRLLGRSDSYVLKRLSVLELDPGSLDALVRGEISLHHGLELKRVDDVSVRKYYLDLCVRNGASVAVLSGWVDAYQREGPGAPSVDLGSGTVAYGPTPMLPVIGCRVCGRDTGQVMLHAIMMCSECDNQLRAAMAGPVQKQGS